MLYLVYNSLGILSADHIGIQIVYHVIQSGVSQYNGSHIRIILYDSAIMADKTDFMPMFYQPLHDICLVGMVTRGYIQESHINLFSFKLYLPPFRNLCLITHHPGTQIYLCIAGDAEPIIQQFLSHFLVHSLTLRA